jgi:phenylpropionate dioxygenase-like ring-hydroxylating dioxygenase large terminal subunit
MSKDRLIAQDEDVDVAYRRAWFPVTRSQDLTGGPQPVTLLGESLVAFRAEDRSVHVTKNRCAHRGALLHTGKVVANEIQCPYHGWRFEGSSGRCTAIPSSGPDTPVPPGVQISAYPAVERFGLVWTCLEPGYEDFPDFGFLDDWDSWQNGNGDPIHVGCGIRHTVENFRDVAHFAFVHVRTMGEMDPYVEPLKVDRDGYMVTMERGYNVAGGFEEIWHSDMVFTYHVKPPALVCLKMEGREGLRYTIHAAQPVDDKLSIIYFATAVTPTWTGVPIAEAVRHEHIIYSEDSPIISQLEPREAPLFGTAGLFHSPADKFTLGYRRAFAEWARDVALRGADEKVS